MTSWCLKSSLKDIKTSFYTGWLRGIECKILVRGFTKSYIEGLSKVVIFVKEPFSWLDKLISKLFHQFCFIHLYRNLKNKLTLKSMKEVYKLWREIISALDIEGRKIFGRLLELIKEINPEYGEYLQKYRGSNLSLNLKWLLCFNFVLFL